eukprot:3941536-Rhodomonas_salina.1
MGQHAQYCEGRSRGSAARGPAPAAPPRASLAAPGTVLYGHVSTSGPRVLRAAGYQPTRAESNALRVQSVLGSWLIAFDVGTWLKASRAATRSWVLLSRLCAPVPHPTPT